MDEAGTEHHIPPGPKDQDKHAECATTADQKRFATLAARCALADVLIHRRADGWYVIERWALRRELASLDAVACWLNALTGEES